MRIVWRNELVIETPSIKLRVYKPALKKPFITILQAAMAFNTSWVSIISSYSKSRLAYNSLQKQKG